MIKYMIWVILGAATVSAAFFIGSASAHQSGCHRWHSCPSDSGSYICGDLGYTSGCYDYEEEETYSPPVKTYAWRGQLFLGYESYYQKRWDDIQALYRDLLGRNFYTQDEGKIYAASDKTYDQIRDEINGSQEHKNYVQKLSDQAAEKARIATVAQAATSAASPQDNEVSGDWVWWVLGISLVGYVVYKAK